MKPVREKIDMDEYRKVNLQLWIEKWKNLKLESEKKENEQLLKENTHTQNNTEDIKPMLKSNKIEFLDE